MTLDPRDLADEVILIAFGVCLFVAGIIFGRVT